MIRLISRVLHTGFFRVFHFSDSDARGRCVMLASSILNSCITYLTAGVFYTGFLVANDIDIVNLGIINFLPLLANCLSVFAPLILERFSKRRYLLAGARFLYFTILILGVTLLPLFVSDKATKVVCFGVIVFVANAVNALTCGGYSIWHLNFIPNSVRTEYFSYQQIIGTTISSAVLLVSSFAADALAGSAKQLDVLYTLRFIAYFLALADVTVLLLPREYPYPKKAATISVKNVFTLSWQNRKFFYTMLIIAAWTFISYFTSSSLYYYLLENIGVSYTFINMIDASYALFLIALSPLWRRFIHRRGWFYTFAVTAMLHFPTMLLYCFITKGNYIWLMLTVRLTQHVIGVGINLAYANLPFINLPQADQSNYLVFYTLLVNLSGFIGLTASTWFISLTEGHALSLFGLTFANVPILILAQGVGQLLIGFLVYRRRRALAPTE